MSTQAMKLALEALEELGKVMVHYPMAGKAITALREALANETLDKMAENARELGLDYEPAQLPFGVSGGLIAIKTLLSRDPCVHANTAIQMIDAILAEQPAQQRTEELLEIFKDVDQCGPLLGMGQPAPVQQEPVWNNLPSNKDVEDAMRLKRLNQLTSPPAQRKPLTDEQKRELIKKSAVWDMHLHVGWYSAPSKSFVEKAIQLISDIEAAHGIKENT